MYFIFQHVLITFINYIHKYENVFFLKIPNVILSRAILVSQFIINKKKGSFVICNFVSLLYIHDCFLTQS